MPKIIHIISFLFLLPTIGFTQGNLVSNHGFESQLVNRCSMSSSAGSLPSATQDWLVPTTASPDIYSSTVSISCFTKIPASLHNWRIGTEASIEGNHYAGFFAYGAGSVPNYREYLQTQLITPLVVGQKYDVSFYVSLADQSGFGCNNLGVYFSTTAISGTTDGVLAGYTPQILETNVINVAVGWVLISGSFIATAAFEYATFGNFHDDASTTPSAFRNPTGVTGDFWYLDDAYYYIDDIQVVPGLQILSTDTICLGDAATLQGNNSATYSWADSLTSSTIISTDSVLIVTPAITTTYFLYGDNDTISHTVYVNFLPSGNLLGNDTTLCQGAILLLNATTPNASYLWQDNSTNSTFNVTQQGTYWVDISINGCNTRDTINISFNAAPSFSLGNDTNLCTGDNLLVNIAAQNATYLWQDGSTNSSFIISQTGIYWATLTLNNCSVTDSINIITNPTPAINLGIDPDLCDGEILMLDATTFNATYLWHDNTINPTYLATDSGTYWVTITVNNCTNTDTININYTSCQTTPEPVIILTIPNVFTPNGDGNNDLFMPIKTEGIKSLTTEIYNRWGQLIFESSFITIGWDGKTSAGKSVPDGTYFYIVKGIGIDNSEHHKKSSFTLIR